MEQHRTISKQTINIMSSALCLHVWCICSKLAENKKTVYELCCESVSYSFMEQMELELSLQIAQEALTQPPNYYRPQPELQPISQINKPDNTIKNNNNREQ